MKCPPHDRDQQAPKSRGENDQVSDAGSCFEEDSSGMAVDLNLDLKISIPFTSPANAEEEQKHIACNSSTELDFSTTTPTPALLLFR
jgi:hypothetical protein